MSTQDSKPWLAEYGSAIPEHIDAEQISSVVQLLSAACQRYADKQAFSSFGSGLSYRQIDALAQDFAAWLQQVAGIAKGDRVALMAPNIMAFPVAMFGIMRCGAVQVNVNPLYTSRELQHQLLDAEVEIIVIFAAASETLAEIIEHTSIKLVIIVQAGDLLDRELPEQSCALVNGEGKPSVITLPQALAEGAKCRFEAVEISGDDLLFLQYTGGTTGLSKGAMLSHRNLIANILQYEAFAGEDNINRGEEVIVTATPMYHVFALMVNALTYFHFGACNVLIANPRDMDNFVAEWARWPVTTFTGVNTIYNGLLLHPEFGKIDFSTLRLSIGGGATVQAAVSEKWKTLTGRHIREGYGLSETSPVLTLNPFHSTTFKNSIGIPLPSTDIVLLDELDRRVAPGETGELCARGPQVMQGYWKQPQATAEVMTADGYFRTGDIATMDTEGYFKIVDRKKDMILVSGFNVYPNEIEAVVAYMPQVAECACVGTPDDNTGEAVRLFVIRLDDKLSEDMIAEHCRRELAAYKVPRDFLFVDELPKSTVGKILRRELREHKFTQR